MSRDFFREMFDDYDDLQIVDNGTVDRVVTGAEVDVVITTVVDSDGHFRWPPIAFAEPRDVLAVTVAGSQVTLCEIRPHNPPMQNPTPDELVAAIRTAVAQWR